MKSLFDLPTKTPTPAILHTLGLPYTTNRIKKKQLLFLHRLLNKDPNQQTRKMLKVLDKLKVGWTKQVRSMLVLYQLPTDFTTIKNTPFPHWKNYVIAALEKRHKERLLEDCHKKEHGQPIPKTKTTSIIDEINNVNYKRKPCNEIMSCNKAECKAIIMARYGMLECGRNFKGTLEYQC